MILLLSLPLCNPWVHGDGVGYYAYARSLLIERNLNFEQDWKHGNESFEISRMDARGNILPDRIHAHGSYPESLVDRPGDALGAFPGVTHARCCCAIISAPIPADGFSRHI